MVVEGSPFFYVKIDYYVTSVLCNVRLLFLLSLAYIKKSLYLCSANPQWGSASGGAVVRAAVNKSISTDILSARVRRRPRLLITLIRSGLLRELNIFVGINSVGKQTC